MGSSSKKRNVSVFDAIQTLESQDVRAESKRRKKSTSQVHRAQAAQSQTKVYNHLVECRILMQRAMTSVNEEEEDTSVEKNCNFLLETLLQARRQLLAGDNDDDDENDDNEYSDMIQSESSRELHETLEQEYDTCREEWKGVFNRRHKDLRLHSGVTAKSQFRIMDSSFWQQVDATVEYEQLRQRSDEEKAKFDDSKVYQQLLKDFVAHSAAANGNVDGAKRLKTKSSQSKKKQVDRRASKGRKIRYKEIPKLVNFTFPLSRPESSNLNQDEWFQSLFGGVGKN